MSGDDLKLDERKALGLSDTQLAFRAARLKDRAKEAGLVAGDVVVAINDKSLDMTATEFRQYLRREFLVGDTITLTVLREEKPQRIPLKLSPP
jgi:S1-C subfamily serine protease